LPHLHDPLIIALDFPTQRDALIFTDTIGELADYYKIGSVLFTREGPSVVKSLKERKKKVFLDLKFHDIPNTVSDAVSQAADMGIDMLTIHLSGGSAMIRAAVKSAQKTTGTAPDSTAGKTAVKIIGVTVLTSITAGALADDLGISLGIDGHVSRLAGMGITNGIDGIVCSPQETSRLRTQHGKNFIIVNPGIRMEDDIAGDQKRTSGPAEALRSGADFLVIGRPITRASDPRKKVMQIRALLQDISAGQSQE